MTRPAPRPFDSVRTFLFQHRQVFGEATIVIATALFLLLGAYLSLTMLHLR